MNDAIKKYIIKHPKWKESLAKIINILHNTELKEGIKWGRPTYYINENNVISLGAFKNHCGIWFFQGALLSDPNQVLINAQVGKTKAMRSIQIKSDNDLDLQMIQRYINEAIENAKLNKKVAVGKSKKSSPLQFKIHPLLKLRLDQEKSLSKSYYKLTSVQQRDYNDYIEEAKRDSTKTSRLKKIIPLIKQLKPLGALWTK